MGIFSKKSVSLDSIEDSMLISSSSDTNYLKLRSDINYLNAQLLALSEVKKNSTDNYFKLNEELKDLKSQLALIDVFNKKIDLFEVKLNDFLDSNFNKKNKVFSKSHSDLKNDSDVSFSNLLGERLDNLEERFDSIKDVIEFIPNNSNNSKPILKLDLFKPDCISLLNDKIKIMGDKISALEKNHDNFLSIVVPNFPINSNNDYFKVDFDKLDIRISKLEHDVVEILNTLMLMSARF